MKDIIQWLANNYEWLIPTIIGLFGIKVGYTKGKQLWKVQKLHWL